MAVRSILRSFAHRNFRLFFAGQGLSLIGTQMQIIALPWMVYRLTNSATWLAAVSFAGQFPAVFATPLAGYFADRVNKRRLLLVTQTLAMLQAFGLAALAISGRIEVWQVVLLNIGMGIVNAFDLTSRQAFLHEIIDDREDLGNAIALNSSMFNATRLIGPAVAGQLIVWVGEGWCFLINGCSFLAVLVALLRMRLPAHAKPSDSGIGAGLTEGIAAALRSMPIRSLLLLVALVSFFAVPYHVLLPVLVKTVFAGDAPLNGWMFTAAGLGALSGGLFLAARRSVLGVLRFLPALPALTGIAMLALASAARTAVALMLVYLIGLSVVMLLTTCNTVLQTIVEDRLRGRILSLYALTFLGLGPLGSVAAGTLAQQVDVQTAMRFSGLALLAGAAAFAFWLIGPLCRRVREIYLERDLLVAEVPEPTA